MALCEDLPDGECYEAVFRGAAANRRKKIYIARIFKNTLPEIRIMKNQY
jgi:hypothetical protein